MNREMKRERIAHTITEITAPVPLALISIPLIAWRAAADGGDGWKWAIFIVLLVPVPILLYILRSVHRGRITDRHVGARHQRPRILVVGLFCVVLAFALLAVGKAPVILIAFLASGIVGIVIALAITLVWKISLHTGVATGILAILVSLFGPRMLLLSPLVAVVGWARVALGDPTPLQVLSGACIGGSVSLATFLLVMRLLG